MIGTLPNESKVEHLPTLEWVTDPVGVPAGDYVKFSYRRTTASMDAGVTAAAEYDTDLLDPWTTAVDTVGGVVILELPNAEIPGNDVEVYIPRNLAVAGKLFSRLTVTVP